MEPLMLKMSDASKRWSVSRKTLVRMLNEGLIAGDRTPGGDKRPGHWRINRESGDAYFMRSEQKSLAIVQELGL
jgi:predicted site-specific integrase-resolvase